VVECICSLVALAALVEIRITAFYELARIHNKQSIQRRRFFEDFAISVILRQNPYENLRLFLLSKISAVILLDFLRRFFVFWK